MDPSETTQWACKWCHTLYDQPGFCTICGRTLIVGPAPIVLPPATPFPAPAGKAPTAYSTPKTAVYSAPPAPPAPLAPPPATPTEPAKRQHFPFGRR
jgi:hypothetical protein